MQKNKDKLNQTLLKSLHALNLNTYEEVNVCNLCYR